MGNVNCQNSWFNEQQYFITMVKRCFLRWLYNITGRLLYLLLFCFQLSYRIAVNLNRGTSALISNRTLPLSLFLSSSFPPFFPNERKRENEIMGEWKERERKRFPPSLPYPSLALFSLTISLSLFPSSNVLKSLEFHLLFAHCLNYLLTFFRQLSSISITIHNHGRHQEKTGHRWWWSLR